MRIRDLFQVLRIRFQNKFLIFKRSKKLTFEKSVWVKKLQHFLFKKIRARVTQGSFFSGCYQKMQKGYSSKLIRVRIENHVAELRNIRKNNVWSLDFSEKLQI